MKSGATARRGFVAVGVALGMAACASGRSEDAGDIVATWRGGEIRRPDHASWLAFHRVPPGPDAVREHAFVESFAAASRQRGAERDPRTKFELEAAVQQVLLPALRKHVAGDAPIGDDELEEARRSRAGALDQPARLRLRSIHLRLDADPKAAAATRARAQALHRELVGGGSFEAVARRDSESQSRYRDGDVGFVALDRLPPEVAAAVRDLLPGEISSPVEHGGGISIFRVEERRPGTRRDPAAVDESLRGALKRRRAEQAWRRLRDELWEAARASIEPWAAVPLTMEGYRVTAEELPALAEVRLPGRTLVSLSPPERERLLRSWAIGVQAVKRATALGLDKAPEAADALRWRRLDVLARAELVRRVDATIGEPDEAALRAFFGERRESYREPQAFELAAIFFGAGGKDARGRVATATEVSRRLDKHELTFEEAARRYSRHTSASSGGRLGWVPRPEAASAWGSVAVRALLDLEPGRHTGVLHVESGLWIFQLVARRAAREPAFEEVRPRVRRDWRRSRAREIEADVRREQIAALDVLVHG